MTYRLVDLFCKAGGSSKGYADAGFEVWGVDIEPQPHFPFPERFIQADALEWVREHGREFDVITASPPCQFASQITPDKSKYPNLIPATRVALVTSGKPYVIENVTGARRHLRAPVMVCGMPLGLKVYRHRWFESNILLFGVPHYPHRDNTPRAGHGISANGFISVTSGGSSVEVRARPNMRRRGGLPGVSKNGFVSVSGYLTGVDYCRWAMGIDWMTGAELSQAIPPKFTEYIGRQLLDYLARVNAPNVYKAF